jgi:hypothetical protein
MAETTIDDGPLGVVGPPSGVPDNTSRPTPELASAEVAPTELGTHDEATQNGGLVSQHIVTQRHKENPTGLLGWILPDISSG